MRSDVVAPVEVLIEMGNLSSRNYDAWQAGKVPCLERVFEGSLSKAKRILRLYDTPQNVISTEGRNLTRTVKEID